MAHPGPRRTTVIDDYGPVGKGASAAHFVLAENGNEYIIKGPAFTPGHLYVAANELVAAQIAGTLALPVLDYCVVEMGGELYSGSAWMKGGSFHDQTSAALFGACTNAERVYDIVVFDVFVCNIDRHSQNLLVRSRRPRGAASDQHLVLMNDHSHCLVTPGNAPAHLVTLLGTPPAPYVGLDFVRDSIVEPATLSRSIATFEALADETLEEIVEGLPDAFFPTGGKREYIDFLAARREELRTNFEANRALFGNLKVGPIA